MIQAQLKSGFLVFKVLRPDVFNWWSNLSRTGFLSNSILGIFIGKVVSELDHLSDLAFGNKQFCINHNLDDIVFLSDMRNEDFANNFGILHTNGKFQGLLARSVIVTDSNHKIIHTQLVEQTGHEPDYNKVVELLT